MHGFEVKQLLGFMCVNYNFCSWSVQGVLLCWGYPRGFLNTLSAPNHYFVMCKKNIVLFFFLDQKTKQAEQVHWGPEAEVHPARSAGRRSTWEE